MPRSRKSLYATNYRAFLALLVSLRQENEITQVELAARMGTSQSMLSKLERGVVRMDVMDLLDYLAGVEVNPVQFMKLLIKQR